MRWIMGALGLALLVGAECGSTTRASTEDTGDTADSGDSSYYYNGSVQLWSFKISDTPGDNTYEFMFTDNFTNWTWGYEDDTTGDYTTESDSGGNDIEPAVGHVFHDYDGNVSLRYFPAVDNYDGDDVPVPNYFEDYIGTVTINDDGSETWTFVCTYTDYVFHEQSITDNNNSDAVVYYESRRSEQVVTMTITMTVNGNSATGTYQETRVSTDTCEQTDEWDSDEYGADSEDTDDYCLIGSYSSTSPPAYMLDSDGLGNDSDHNDSGSSDCDGDTCTLTYTETCTEPVDTFTAVLLSTEYPDSTGYNEPFEYYEP